MDVRSAIALQRKQFKTLPPKKKWEHILEYYKGWLLLGVILIAITGYSIYTAQTRKEPVLYVTMVNASDSESDVFQGFLENVGLPECFLMEYADRLHTVVLSSGGKEIVAGIYPTSDSRFGHAGYYEPAAPVGIVTNAINLGTAAAALMWLSAIPE